MIVVVEDRRSVGEAYAAGFAREGVSATSLPYDEFGDWFASIAASEISAVEAILIGSGQERETLPRFIHQRANTAVIALIERRCLEETLLLLAAGCDDVVAKPVHVRELLARIAVIRSRRTPRPETANSADIRIFDDGRDPEIHGEALQLPRRERRVLECLARNGEAWISKVQIFNHVYGLLNEGVDETVIETHISRLRKRLRQRLGRDPIQSQRFLGYRLSSTARQNHAA